MTIRKFIGRYILPIIRRFFRIYWFVARPSYSGAKVILKNGKDILFVRPTHSRNIWTFPGGRVERGETPEEGAIREIQEELGITLSSIKFLGTVFSNSEYKKDTIYCYFTEIFGKNFKIDDLEIEEILWAPSEKVPVLGPGAQKIFELYKSSIH